MGRQLADLDLSARHLNAEAKLYTAQREGYRESGLLGFLVASFRRSLGCGVDPATLGGGVGVDLAFGPEQEEELSRRVAACGLCGAKTRRLAVSSPNSVAKH